MRRSRGMHGGKGKPGPNGLPQLTAAAFQVFVNPLMMWAWLGLTLTIGGLLIAIWTDPKEALRPVPVWERARQELGQRPAPQKPLDAPTFTVTRLQSDVLTDGEACSRRASPLQRQPLLRFLLRAAKDKRCWQR